MELRQIRKVFKSKPTIEGAGVHLKRAFGFNEVPLFDPFLLFDDFRSSTPEHYSKGFPWHPHRGIETITYVLCGDIEHGDSLGNSGIISTGDVQWMTAGSGIIHQEMPKGDRDGSDLKGVMLGFQLWANLPAAYKMMSPRYREVKAEQIPELRLENGTIIKNICGRVGDTTGPVRDIVIEPEYLDISVPANTVFEHPTTWGHTVFAYVISGKGYFSLVKERFTHEVEDIYSSDIIDPYVGNETLILYENGERILVSTKDKPLRFLLVSGKPVGEPIAWRGPIVMNTDEELQLAFEEYRVGTFIKHDAL